MNNFRSIPDLCHDVFNSFYYGMIYKRIESKLENAEIWFLGRQYVKKHENYTKEGIL